MLVTGRLVCSSAWPEGASGRYYWQHCVYVDTGDFANDSQMALQTLNRFKLLYTSQVQLHGLRWFLPGTETIYFTQTFTVAQFGSLSSVENPDLLVCARWHLFGDDGSYTYHLHRQPIGADYLEGGQWSATGGTQNAARVNTFVLFGKFRTKSGALVDTGWAGSEPTPWQLRHGTKRRARRGWLP